MRSGTLHLPRDNRREVVAREDIVDLAKGRPMPQVVDCRECPATFVGPSRWNDYAEHLRDEHPQTEVTPPQRPPEPPAKEIAMPPTTEKLACQKCGRDDFVASKGLATHERFCKGLPIAPPSGRG